MANKSIQLKDKIWLHSIVPDTSGGTTELVFRTTSVDANNWLELIELVNIEVTITITPAPRCPECGYTEADARFHMNHQLCKNYPFFTQPGGYEVIEETTGQQQSNPQ